MTEIYMLRKLWHTVSFRASTAYARPWPYVPRRIRSRLNLMLIFGNTVILTSFTMAALSVYSQGPPLDAAVKLADAVEHKSVTWLVAMAAIVAMLVNVYLVNVVVGLVKDSIKAAAEVRSDLHTIKSLIRNHHNINDDDTPGR